jgi:hypothetical protein
MNQALDEPQYLSACREAGVDPTPGSTPEDAVKFVKAAGEVGADHPASGSSWTDVQESRAYGANDPRPSLEERYPTDDSYVGKAALPQRNSSPIASCCRTIC